MRIEGLQKTTLLDFPGKVACTIFTEGCNFRCPFCHNSSLVICDKKGEDPTYSEEEILKFLKKRQGILDGVCITGGEPMMQSDLEEFIEKIKKLGYLVKLDTNGSEPMRLKKLIDDGLIDYVAMDVKNCKEEYARTIGVKNYPIDRIEESISILLEDRIPYEFRTTVVKEFHTAENMIRLAQWIKGAKNYYMQQFVDSEDVMVKGLHSCDPEEIFQWKKKLEQYIDNVEVRGI